MNRDQKAAVIDEIAAQIEGAQAIFAVDYRGISVPQAAELRDKLREADASFRVVKNSLTERAADQAQAQTLKALLQGPTALAFVRGDAAAAAKAIADYARATDLLPFKGGLLDGDTLNGDEIRAIARLPARQVLYGQLVGMVASPISGLVRTLNALISGLALQLGQIHDQKQSGKIPAGAPPAAPSGASDPPAAPAGASDPPAAPSGASDPPAAPVGASDPPASGAGDQDAEKEPVPPPPSQAEGDDPPAPEIPAETATEPAESKTASADDDNQVQDPAPADPADSKE